MSRLNAVSIVFVLAAFAIGTLFAIVVNLRTGLFFVALGVIVAFTTLIRRTGSSNESLAAYESHQVRILLIPTLGSFILGVVFIVIGAQRALDPRRGLVSQGLLLLLAGVALIACGAYILLVFMRWQRNHSRPGPGRGRRDNELPLQRPE